MLALGIALMVLGFAGVAVLLAGVLREGSAVQSFLYRTGTAPVLMASVVGCVSFSIICFGA